METINDYDTEEPLTSTVRPATRSTITVRVIKSFAYRNVKSWVFHDIDLTKTTIRELMELMNQVILSNSLFRPFKTSKFDTLKLYTKAHGAKTMNLTINMEDDQLLILKELDKTLYEYGVENETEISYFKMADYLEFKANPAEKW
ncbi:Aim29p ASCRUDRAFT_71131 [Ascoidea rubescens DSM 1968]|uniref:Uncharacterized protein n=1 Tax=Ascoidea rubescens DSM 1968 TaxID=1344418 RepID=A0A1D2VF38_9ASCO|nr:hypothetical protein ASCRUDRAFT_71131 [Ascoidea rubescens DSM 1968]ODV60087.1 hypothetical protein ASCRUDRAFT_71131 [Ascoidea rubescens DSM 1968]